MSYPEPCKVTHGPSIFLSKIYLLLNQDLSTVPLHSRGSSLGTCGWRRPRPAAEATAFCWKQDDVLKKIKNNYPFTSVSDPDESGVFSPIRIQTLKTRIWFRPFFALVKFKFFNKLKGPKWCSLIRFWRNLTKKDSAKYLCYTFFYLYLPVKFLAVFYGSRIRDFRIGSEFCGRSGLRKKKVWSGSGKRYTFFLLVLTVFGCFFHGSGFRIRNFRIGYEFFGQSGLRKKVWSGSGQKDPHPKHCILL